MPSHRTKQKGRSTAGSVPRRIKVGEGKFARNFFRYGEAVAFIDARAGDPPRQLSETDRVRLITAREFRHLLGDVSEMFLWRLLNRDRATGTWGLAAREAAE
jgi:hypothetical protein